MSHPGAKSDAQVENQSLTGREAENDPKQTFRNKPAYKVNLLRKWFLINPVNVSVWRLILAECSLS